MQFVRSGSDLFPCVVSWTVLTAGTLQIANIKEQHDEVLRLGSKQSRYPGHKIILNFPSSE